MRECESRTVRYLMPYTYSPFFSTPECVVRKNSYDYRVVSYRVVHGPYLNSEQRVKNERIRSFARYDTVVCS